jgi:ankyrin repeat protein
MTTELKSHRVRLQLFGVILTLALLNTTGCSDKQVPQLDQTQELIFALDANNTSEIESLLRANPTLSSVKAHDGRTPLLWAARSDQLIRHQTDLSNATLDNFARKKKNNAALEDAQVKRNKLVHEVRSLMLDDRFLDDLRKRNLLSQEAVRSMRKSADGMTDMDGSLETAHRLLQEVWDGAARDH